MLDRSKLGTCQLVCWGLAVVVGVLVLLSTSGAVGFLAALLLGLACAAFFGLVTTRLICTGQTSEDRGREGTDATTPAAEPTTTAATAPRTAPPAAESGATAVKPDTTPNGNESVSAPKAKPEASGSPAGAGTRPEALSAPKGGKADDLKQIKGVGPKLEKLCNELGFYHFDQIAGWGADEVTWVDQNLKGFKGRVSRDNWVEQAKVLAAGGETEFSKRVAKGGVYEG